MNDDKLDITSTDLRLDKSFDAAEPSGFVFSLSISALATDLVVPGKSCIDS